MISTTPGYRIGTPHEMRRWDSTVTVNHRHDTLLTGLAAVSYHGERQSYRKNNLIHEKH